MAGRNLLAWNLRRIRVQQNLSQEQLATDAGIDRTYVSRLERAVENPTLAILDRLSAALSVPVSDFLLEPRPRERAPQPLRSGRRKKTVVGGKR